MRARHAAAVLLCLLAAGTAAGAPQLRTATPADDGDHPGAGARTEWWFVGARDPGQRFSVAVALGARFPRTPPATVVFLFMPDGTTRVAAALRPGAPRAARGREDVRLGPDRLWSPRPGVVRVRVSMPAPVALHGPPTGPVTVDLTLRATGPGFTAGPLALPDGQDLSWTVGAPAALASGTVRAGGPTIRLQDARAYHDHNYGRFDLSDDAHGGWDWSEIGLPGGRSLVTGIVRPRDPAPRDGVAVLSGPAGRIADARAADVAIARGDWSATGNDAYPRRLTLHARMSGGRTARVTYRARRAAPLSFRLDGTSALVEVEAVTSGVLRRGGRVVERWSSAPAFYEYESTPLTRQRDAAPGSPAWAGRLAAAAAGALMRSV